VNTQKTNGKEPAERIHHQMPVHFAKESPQKERMNNKKIVCIGTSTGGPRALQTVLSSLPENLEAPVLIVQHMPSGFTKSLANRLNTICSMTVKEAEDGEMLKKGVAYIAPGDFHMMIEEQGGRIMIRLDKSPPVNGHRPAVDKTFESASHLKHYEKIAVIMTGMGSDGTKGLIELKKRGNVRAIAESEESCIVYGMPRSAIATNLIDEIVHLNHIADAIVKFICE